MGIADLTPENRRLSVLDVLADLDDAKRERLLYALTTKRRGSRLFVWSEREIAKACAEDGYDLPQRAVGHWREQHGH